MERQTDEFWKGSFGNDYTARNSPSAACLRYFFENALIAIDEPERTEIKTILELGANVGHNLAAIRNLLPRREMTGVEINSDACRELRHVAHHVHCSSLLDLDPVAPFDLVFTKGVLIHIAPVDLAAAYEVIHKAAAKWILIAEYYCPKPREIPYRGHKNRLWARDFAGELMDAYPDVKLVDYGFAYHRDRFPQDDLNWFLLQKVHV